MVNLAFQNNYYSNHHPILIPSTHRTAGTRHDKGFSLSQMSTTGEQGIVLLLIVLLLAALRRCSLQTPPFFLGVIFGGWLSLSFLVGHGGGAPSWLPGLGGGWGGHDPAPLFCSAPSKRSTTVLMPLPDVFEPMEVVVPWSILIEQGHTVAFMTKDGKPSVPAAHRMHGVLSGQFLRDEEQVLEQTRIMIKDPSFRSPIKWDHRGGPLARKKIASLVDRASGAILTGGLAPGSTGMLESESLQTNVILPMWSAEKSMGAISRGVLVLARTMFPGTNTSILVDRKVAAPRVMNERLEHWLLNMFGVAGSSLGHKSSGSGGDPVVVGGASGGGGRSASGGGGGGRSSSSSSSSSSSDSDSVSGCMAGGGGGGGGACSSDMRYTSERLIEVLKWPNQQIIWEPMFTLPWLNFHPSTDMRHARVVRDSFFLSAASRKDILLFSHRYIAMLHGTSSTSSGFSRHTMEQACHDDVVLCLPLKMGGLEKQLNFVVHRADLFPGRLLSKAQKFVRKHGGVYRDGEAMSSDVDVLYRSATESLEKLGEITGFETSASKPGEEGENEKN